MSKLQRRIGRLIEEHGKDAVIAAMDQETAQPCPCHACKDLEDGLGELLQVHGGQLVLIALGGMFQQMESGGNGYYVGKALEALAGVEW